MFKSICYFDYTNSIQTFAYTITVHNASTKAEKQNDKTSSTYIHFQLLMNDSKSCRALIPIEYSFTDGSSSGDMKIQCAS